MKRLLLSLSALATIGLIVAVAGAATGLQRSDCPGKITCPLTGEEVCKDQCPATDAAREDCPSKIACPLSGDLVCRDQCPLADAAIEAAPTKRSCCRVE